MSDAPVEISRGDMSSPARSAVLQTIDRDKQVSYNQDPQVIKEVVAEAQSTIVNSSFEPTKVENNVAKSAGISTGIAAAVATYHAEIVGGLVMGWQLSELVKSPDPTMRSIGIGAIGLIAASTVLDGREKFKSWKNIVTSGARLGIRVGKFVTEATAGAIESAKKKAAFKEWLNSEGILRTKDLKNRDLKDARRMETEGFIGDKIIQFKNRKNPPSDNTQP